MRQGALVVFASWLLGCGGMIAHAQASEPPRSGYDFADPSTQAMQDDDFANPGFLWVEQAQTLWSTLPAGDAGKACATCHGAVTSLRGVAVRYPLVDPASGEILTLEEQINRCRRAGGGAPWAYDSDELLGMTALVKLYSRGLPVAVETSGPAARWYALGEHAYRQPIGQLDLSCANCHDEHSGEMLRAERLSQGQSNGFPTYRLKWQSLGSLHRRFAECNRNIGAEPLPPGDDLYRALELYLAARGRGLPLEAPAVRK